jgi:ribonuclease P/MRP protein subunit POP5
MIRVARQHYRIVWAAITFLTTVDKQAVLARVVAVSGKLDRWFLSRSANEPLGTIRKLQNRAIGYHRQVTAQLLAVSLDGGMSFRPLCRRIASSRWPSSTLDRMDDRR